MISEISSQLGILNKIHSKATEIINAAKKKTNKEISDETRIHITTVSNVLNRAKGFGWVDKSGTKWFKTKLIKGYNLNSFLKDDKKISFNGSNKENYQKKVKQTKKNYSNSLIQEANKNSSTYIDIYVVENLLRETILEAFGMTSDWWKEEKVPKPVLEYAEKIERAESNHPWIKKRGNHKIYYVGLEELKKILTKHWDNNFKWIGEREKFFVWIDELIPIRNMVAHNVPLEKEEVSNAETKSKWLINLVNNQKVKLENETTKP